MGLFDSLRPSTFDTDPPAETRQVSELEYQVAAIQYLQAIGGRDPESLPAVYAALDLIAASVSRLRLLPDSPLSRRPDPFTSRSDFFYETAWSLAAAGDAYWLQTRSPRGVDSLEVLDPGAVSVRFAEGSRRRRRYWLSGDELDSRRISHLRFHPRPGRPTGLSPIEAARTTWSGAVAGESWGSDLFARAGIPSGVLAADYEISKSEAQKLKADWDEARAGTRDTAILGGGLKYVPVSLSPADLAWLDYRGATALDVARIFHIPADLLEVATEGSSLTYQNLAEVGADFVRWCLDSYLSIIVEAWELLPGESTGRAFDTRPLYTASAEARSRTLVSLVSAGADFDSAARETDFPELSPTPSSEEAQL